MAFFETRLPDWSEAGNYTSAYQNINTNEVLFAETINNKIKAFSGTSELIMEHWKLLETKKHLSDNQFQINYFHRLFDSTLLFQDTRNFINKIRGQKSISFVIHFGEKTYTEKYYQRFLDTILYSMNHSKFEDFFLIPYHNINIKLEFEDGKFLKFHIDDYHESAFEKFMIDLQLRTNHFIIYSECFHILSTSDKEYERISYSKQLKNF